MNNPVFLRWLLNSLIFAVGVTIFNVLSSGLAGYALGCMRFRGREFFRILTLAIMLVPLPIIAIPRFIMAFNLHLTNSFAGLILPLATQPLTVFVMLQFMKSLPFELAEAAFIDGASLLRTFFQGAWNEFFWSLLITQRQDMLTLPIGLSFFQGAHYTEYNLLLAGSMFNTIPIVIVLNIEPASATLPGYRHNRDEGITVCRDRSYPYKVHTNGEGQLLTLSVRVNLVTEQF
ncbi:MAG: carbohydrate ABC transporter permease [Ktedonobacteraceae bacterium]